MSVLKQKNTSGFIGSFECFPGVMECFKHNQYIIDCTNNSINPTAEIAPIIGITFLVIFRGKKWVMPLCSLCEYVSGQSPL